MDSERFQTAVIKFLFITTVLLVSFCPLSIAWKNGWQIISPKKSFAVFAATPTEKAEWMAHINKCIAELLAKSESNFLPLSRNTIIHLFFIACMIFL